MPRGGPARPDVLILLDSGAEKAYYSEPEVPVRASVGIQAGRRPPGVGRPNARIRTPT